MSRFSPDSGPHLTLYTAPGCCLCDDMKAQLDALRARGGFTLEIVDISGLEELEARFRTEIPVLFADGRKVAKYHATTEALQRIVSARRE